MQCNKYSAQVWNLLISNDISFREKKGKSMDLSGLQKLAKRSVPHITANSISYIIFKYMYTRNAMYRSIMKKHDNSKKVKLPYKEKKFFNTGWTYQSIKIYKDKNYITLARPVLYDNNGSFTKQKPIKCHVRNIPDNIVEIELVYRGKLYFVIKTKQENDNVLIQSDNVAAIDLGEIHSITSIDNNQNAIIITGKKLREIKQFRNKEMGKIKSRISKCKKGSRQYKKYNKALWNLKYKTDRKILDAVHKITKYYVDYCLENNIGKVYYGDLDGCARSAKKKNKGNKFVRQKLSQWSHGLIMKELENKLTRYGIELIKVKEYYTSKKCPMCGKLNNPKGRNYCCDCGYIMHRDVNGAINILNDNSNCQILKYNNLKYLRIA